MKIGDRVGAKLDINKVCASGKILDIEDDYMDVYWSDIKECLEHHVSDLKPVLRGTTAQLIEMNKRWEK